MKKPSFNQADTANDFADLAVTETIIQVAQEKIFVVFCSIYVTCDGKYRQLKLHVSA